MSIYAAMVLGLIQGLPEFLPVSSPGHLAVAQHFIPGFAQPGLLFDIVLHLGTLLAVLIYFRREVGLLIWALGPGDGRATWRRVWMTLIVGTLPAVLAALLFGPVIERSFDQLWVAGIGLLVTGALLLGSRRLTLGGRALGDMGARDALTVGLFQSAALLPGISRSGSTIVGGVLRGLSHDAAARFSFLLSLPAILGAAVYHLPRMSLVEADAGASYPA